MYHQMSSSDQKTKTLESRAHIPWTPSPRRSRRQAIPCRAPTDETLQGKRALFMSLSKWYILSVLQLDTQQFTVGLVFLFLVMPSLLEANQAQIDTHLQSVARCLAHPLTPLAALIMEDTTDSEVLAVEPGSRIAAKVMHLQNRIATLPSIPATAESDQCSFFDLFFSGVEVRTPERPTNPPAFPRIPTYFWPSTPTGWLFQNVMSRLITSTTRTNTTVRHLQKPMCYSPSRQLSFTPFCCASLVLNKEKTFECSIDKDVHVSM
ncbi:hypothetical protein F5I97DRAFT_1847999 [Phlebopus sp. FC_14]|nr:hypothetical protein F5I97DRAFT_1847999 [Phlebopus sp. FC_14]